MDFQGRISGIQYVSYTSPPLCVCAPLLSSSSSSVFFSPPPSISRCCLSHKHTHTLPRSHIHTQPLQRCVHCSDLSLSGESWLSAQLSLFSSLCLTLSPFALYISSSSLRISLSIDLSIFLISFCLPPPLLSSPLLHVSPAFASSYLFILSALDSSLLLIFPLFTLFCF